MAFVLSGELSCASFCMILRATVGKQCVVVEQKSPLHQDLLTSDLEFIGGVPSQILVFRQPKARKHKCQEHPKTK